MVVFLHSLAATVGCVFFYGVQFLPAKIHQTYNGAVFHWFMCNGALFTGLVIGVILEGDLPSGTVFGLVGGSLVAISNTIVLHVKRTLGLFQGVVVYQAANLCTGYCVGRFGLLGLHYDPGELPHVRDAGIVALLVSLWLAAMASRPSQRERATSFLSDPLELAEEDFADQDCDDSWLATTAAFLETGLSPARSRVNSEHSDQMRRPSLQRNLAEVPEEQKASEALGIEPKSPASERLGLRIDRTRSCSFDPEVSIAMLVCEMPSTIRSPVNAEVSRNNSASGDADPEDDVCRLPTTADGPYVFPRAENTPNLCPCWSSMTGILLAAVAGVCRGLNPVPFAKWRDNHPTHPAAAFVFPHSLGVWASGTIIYLSYSTGKKVLNLRSPSKPHIRPAFISGCLWALGFACFTLALESLGYTAAFTLSTTGPVLLSQLLSVLVFRELQEKKQLRYFCASAAAQIVGMSLIVVGT